MKNKKEDFLKLKRIIYEFDTCSVIYEGEHARKLREIEVELMADKLHRSWRDKDPSFEKLLDSLKNSVIDKRRDKV